jgi:colicin import membrane protein
LEDQFNQIVNMDVNKETCQKARELRLRYVKVRTGTAEIHRELKAFYLNGGRFVDGWKNAQLFASQGKEKKLSDIENYYENLESERIAKLQEKRTKELEKYELDYIPDNLGSMPEDVWRNFLLGTKTNYENRKEAERKAEQERIAKEKAEAEERERIRKENERLKKEVEERERKAKIEVEKRAKEEAYEAKLKKEREKAEKIQAELRAKKEAEEKAKREKAEAKRKARLAPDKKKLKTLAETIQLIIYPDVKSQEAFDIIQKVRENQEKVVKYILEQAKSL